LDFRELAENAVTRLFSLGARLGAVGALVVFILSSVATPAAAVPAFADQTGLACDRCHVGGFGPQLTPYGRSFKLHGYTQRSGSSFTLPFSAMAVASYVNTQKDQPPPPPHDFATNNNFAIDQISLFLAGGLGEHLGAFIQSTYDGVAHAFHWDNTDIRATTSFDVKDTDVLVGASLNNSPTVEDPWNTLPAWGFPYTASTLAPSAGAAPILSGALAQTSLGLTAYAWINSEYYLAAGAYGSPGATSLRRLGVDPTSPGSIKGLAPYGRIAWQHAFGPHTVEVGGFATKADIYPGLDRTLGLTDDFTDLGLDASDAWTLEDGDVVTVNGRYTHEKQQLNYSFAAGAAENKRDHLDDVRIDASYYWRNKVGATVQLFDTWGSQDSLVYAANRTLSPNTDGVMLQLDGTPFGGSDSRFGPHVNLRVGVQYTLYQRFMGAGHNYDGAGANASNNNTLRIFTWFAF
jgi:hypothetical protein